MATAADARSNSAHRLIRVSIPLLLALLTRCPWAVADVSASSCRQYLGNEQDIPVEAKEILALTDHGMAEICSRRDGRKSYSLSTKVLTGPLGSCRYATGSVFRHDQKAGTRIWDEVAPPGFPNRRFSFVSMALPAAPCPPQGDPKYIDVHEVSEGLFIELMHFWQRMISSETDFDRALEKLPAWQRRVYANGTLRSWLTGEIGTRDPARIFSIRFESPSTIHPEDAPRYSLDAQGGDTLLHFAVDLTGDGIRVLDVREIVR